MLNGTHPGKLFRLGTFNCGPLQYCHPGWSTPHPPSQWCHQLCGSGACVPLSTSKYSIFSGDFRAAQTLWHSTPCGCLSSKKYTAYCFVTVFSVIFSCVTLKLFSLSYVLPLALNSGNTTAPIVMLLIRTSTTATETKMNHLNERTKNDPGLKECLLLSPELLLN